MAEGGDLSSIKDGSDADFEFACTPCGEDDIREEAVKYCPECQEYLCVTCIRHHGRLKASRSHKLLACDDAKHGSSVAMAAKCRYHQDRDIEMYCGTHDMVYCAKCIATEHRGCGNVKSIEELTQSKTPQTEIQRLQDEGTSIHKHLVAASKEKQKNISALEEKKSEIKDKIEDTGKKLKEHIDKLRNEATGTLNRKFTEVKAELQSEVSLITDTIDDIEKSTSQLQTVTSMDVGLQFVYMKLVEKSVAEAKKLHEENEVKGTKVIDFTGNTDLSRSILTATDLGQIVVKSENQRQSSPRQYKMKSKRDINVSMQSDRKICFITDVCQLQDGTILLTDYYNTKIKRLDINYNIRDHCDLDAWPTAICCTGQNEVAVKMRNNKVQFVSVGTSLSKLREIPIVCQTSLGMACCAGELWISTGSGINVYSISGTLLKSIVKDVSGQNIFKGEIQHMAVSDDTVIVTDYCDGAVCLRKDGTVKGELRDQRLKYTTGACISNDKTVFLSGFGSHNIVMFSGDGKCLGELVTEEEGITHPWSLWYDENKDSLILTCLKNSDCIHIVDVSK